ncbi:hypothetical protein HID58_036476, partial [Brassica napus]
MLSPANRSFHEEILITAAHATFYEFNIEISQWSRKDVEGSLFVVKRSKQEPRFQFIVMNHGNTDNLVEDLLGDFEPEKCQTATNGDLCKEKKRAQIAGSSSASGENDLKTYDKWELVSCPSCKALFWNAEAPRVQTNQESKQFSLCCQRGRVRLPPVREPPSPFLELLESPSFKPHIRIANSLLDFPSMGAKIDKSVTGYGHEKISMTPSSN